jgi:hypothetical protein
MLKQALEIRPILLLLAEATETETWLFLSHHNVGTIYTTLDIDL